MTRPGVKPGAPEPHPQISPGSESREKLRSQMGFSLFYFCTLQPLSLSLTIKHNLWATLWWPKERKQQEQKLKGEKGRTISNSLAGSPIPSRNHSRQNDLKMYIVTCHLLLRTHPRQSENMQTPHSYLE